MEGFKYFGHIIVVWVFVVSVSVYGQIRTPCTASMITSFTPCLNFIAQSSGNGSSPTSDCCSSLKSLTSSSMDCACLLITGKVPFQIPINQTLAISLPRACKMGGVPLQCKASVAPFPAPGPASFGSAPSPSDAPTTTSSVPEPVPAPVPDKTTTSTPTSSPPVNSENPTSTPGLRPVETPNSAAKISHIYLPSILLFSLGFMVFN